LKNQRSTTSGGNHIGIQKLEFVTKTHFLLTNSSSVSEAKSANNCVGKQNLKEYILKEKNMDLSCFLGRANLFGELLHYSFSRSKYKRR